MRIVSRALAIATITALASGVGLSASAQPAPGGPPSAQGQMGGQMGGGPGGRGMHGRHGQNMGDPAEHLKELRGDIGITAAQSAAWDAYAKVVLDNATQMRASHEGKGRHSFMEMSTADRLAQLLKQRAEREAAQAAVKTAADALLPVLDDTQKVRALMSLPGLAAPRHMMKQHAMRKMNHQGGGTSVN